MLKGAWAKLEGFPPDAGPSLLAYAPVARAVKALTPPETARAEAFIRLDRKGQYRIGHALLRVAAGALLGLEPERIALPAEGRPRVLAAPGAAIPAANVWLSLAHSGPFIAAVASDRGPLGIDVERLEQERDWAGLAAGMGWGEGAAEKRRFLETWTLREAEFKAGLAEGSGRVRRADSREYVLTLVSQADEEIEWLGPERPGPFRT